MKLSGPVTTTSRWVLSAVCAAFLFMQPVVAGSDQSLLNKDANNVAIEGYDTVAYFTEDRAVKGNPQFIFDWQDARWYFSNADHRDLFAADPERYVPKFGGFCAGAMTRGVVVKADPEAWTIVDGRLYIKVNKEFRDEWRKDPAANIVKAEEAWGQMTDK